ASPARDALDLCCGTGDVAFALARRGVKAGGLDFSAPMLQVAMRRRQNDRSNPRMSGVQFVRGDALHVPFPDRCFDLVTISYGLRNLADLDAGMAEILRVLRPGGRFLSLEFGKPDSPAWRWFYFGYLKHFVPVLGRWFCGDSETHSYILESLTHFPDVTVRLRIAAEPPAEHRDEMFQIPKVEPSPRGAVRLAKFKRQKPSAGPQHAEDLGHSGVKIREIAQAIADRDEVKASVGKRNMERIAPDELHAGNPGIGTIVLSPAHGYLEHWLAEIKAHRLDAAPCEGEGHIAGAAAQVQSVPCRARACQTDQPTLPQAMQPEALQVIDQVVPGGDGGEQVAHSGAALGARCVEFIGHALWSLTSSVKSGDAGMISAMDRCVNAQRCEQSGQSEARKAGRGHCCSRTGRLKYGTLPGHCPVMIHRQAVH